jgi:DNA-binding MarR family transcriptional regulator
MTAGVSEAQRLRRRTISASVSHERLRLWLRMLRASRGIEAELRERLRVTYDITLPQFDVLAALARRDDGISMTELSRYLMVSNGNVTGIIDRLVEQNWVERLVTPGDRRTTRVKLTPKGSRDFADMAGVHERWVDGLLGLYNKAEVGELIETLDRVVDKLRGGSAGGAEPGAPLKRRQRK